MTSTYTPAFCPDRRRQHAHSPSYTHQQSHSTLRGHTCVMMQQLLRLLTGKPPIPPHLIYHAFSVISSGMYFARITPQGVSAVLRLKCLFATRRTRTACNASGRFCERPRLATYAFERLRSWTWLRQNPFFTGSHHECLRMFSQAMPP